jgi:hypothetical protein
MPLLSAKPWPLLILPSWADCWCWLAVLALGFLPVHAQDNYFVTYSHELEDPGTLEISAKNIAGSPKGGDPFVASALEFEYGIKTWWTTEFYLDGQTTSGQSTLFTGFRWENRIRTLRREHWINPVLYFEFADINGADKTLLEVVGHDNRADFLGRNSRHEKKREAELKLILSSNFKGWNISENFLAEKNLANAPWEFGYAVGGSHVLAAASSAKPCAFCPQRFAVGAEMYGGLGNRRSFGLNDTAHYAGPVLTWALARGPELRFSPNFGLNRNSNGFLFRFTVSYEIERFLSQLKRRSKV